MKYFEQNDNVGTSLKVLIMEEAIKETRKLDFMTITNTSCKKGHVT